MRTSHHWLPMAGIVLSADKLVFNQSKLLAVVAEYRYVMLKLIKPPIDTIDWNLIKRQYPFIADVI